MVHVDSCPGNHIVCASGNGPEGGDPRCHWTGSGEHERVKKEPGSLIASEVLQLQTVQLTFIDRTY